jgi:hypothetical protein
MHLEPITIFGQQKPTPWPGNDIELYGDGTIRINGVVLQHVTKWAVSYAIDDHNPQVTLEFYAGTVTNIAGPFVDGGDPNVG